jgi:hypothetical protein
VTRSGRLAILELKASEPIHLALQAARYWLRIRRHLEQCDFDRYGHFPEIELQPLRLLSIWLLRRFASIPPRTFFSASSLQSWKTQELAWRKASVAACASLCANG